MTKRSLALRALLAFPLFLACAWAGDKAKDLPPPTEPTVLLEPFEVKANPFAKWGMGIHWRGEFWSRSLTAMYVSAVIADSPANDAGVQLGDQIKAVNGKPTTDLRLKELENRFYATERGEVITLELFNHATNQTRIAELKLRSHKTWLHDEGIFDLNYWGIRVRSVAPTKFRQRVFPLIKRIARWETAQVVSPHASKKHRIKTVQKPVYTVRRASVIAWADKSLILIERENRIIEAIEARKIPESDDVVGRLVNARATLTLNADGTYELTDAPEKAEATGHGIGDK